MDAGVRSQLHPAIVGLLELLPEPHYGWEGKRAWVEAFVRTIEAVYPDVEVT